MKYILYCRKSTDTEDKQVLSLDSQLSEMSQLAQREGLEIVFVLKESRSAKEPGRPVFNEMLKMIADSDADGILCWKIDRLTRNPVDGGQLQWLLQNHRIKRIRTFERVYEPSDNVLLMSIEQAMANQYIRDLSVNVKRGNRAKLERGEWPNHAPFGYVNDKATKTIVLDHVHAKTIQRVYEVYATGRYTLKEVSNIIYAEGFRSLGGKKIFLSLIERIIKNPFYHGIMLRDGVYYAGKHEPIVSKELWDKAQDVVNCRLHPRSQNLFFPLRGLLSCATCECMYTASLKKGHQYYYCTNGKGVCEEHRSYLTSDTADGFVAEALGVVHFEEEMIEILYLAAKERNGNALSYSQAIYDRLVRRLDALDAKESIAFDSYSDGVLSKPVYEHKVQEIKAERIGLQKEIRDFKKQNPLATLEPTKEKFLKGSRAKTEYLAGNDTKKHDVASSILWNVSLQNQKVAQIKYKPMFDIMAKAPKTGEISALLPDLDSNQDTQIQSLRSYH